MDKLKVLRILFCLIAFGLASCKKTSTPPAPDIVAGVYIDVEYEYFFWEEGLRVMIWHDAISTSSCDSFDSKDTTLHMVACSAQSETRQSFEWRIVTADGLQGYILIDGQSYDLAQGCVFTVDTGADANLVKQFPCDISDVQPDSQSVIDFGLDDPEISQFIQVVSE